MAALEEEDQEAERRERKREENASRKRPMHPSSPLGNLELPESSN
jgi:hypothetical protein